MEERIFVDPEPCKHARRFITVSRPRRYVHLVLNRDSYVDCWPELGGAEGVLLSPSYRAALERCVEAGQLRLWISEGIDPRAGASDRWVELAVPEIFGDEAIEALRAAELEGRLEALDTLTGRMTIPLEEWLAPGRKVFRQGIDFTCKPGRFLQLLRSEADKRRDRRVVGKVDGAVVTVVITPETETEWRLRDLKRRSR